MAIANRTHEANNEAFRVILVMIKTHRSPCRIVCVKVCFCFFSISAKIANIWIWMSSGLEELEEFLPITMGIIKKYSRLGLHKLIWSRMLYVGKVCLKVQLYNPKRWADRYAGKICSEDMQFGKIRWKVFKLKNKMFKKCLWDSLPNLLT